MKEKPIAVRRMEAIAYVRQIQALTHIQQREPRALMGIIEGGLAVTPEENHWIAYERLKKEAKTIVGRGAPEQELNTSLHYTSLLQFIEWLLPPYQEELELLDLDEPLYDEREEERPLIPPATSRLKSGWQSMGQIIEAELAHVQIDSPSEEGVMSDCSLDLDDEN